MSLITSKKISKVYLGSKMLYSSGNVVTYHVDSNTKYTEEFGDGESVLSAKSFVPSKSGWTFVGWREDTVASGDVLSSKIMGDEPITLYAVYEKALVQTFINGNGTTKQTAYMYYNNGNTGKSSFTAPTVSTKSGWTARGWSNNSTAANASVYLTSGQTGITASVENTFYALYEQTVTQEFRSNYSVQKVDGKRYYNSYGNTVNASVTAPNGASMSGWSWRGWASAGVTSGNANVAYANGATIGGLTSSNVYYGLYQQTIYLYYNGNGSASGSVSTQSGTRYYSEGSGNSGTVNPSFKLASNGYSRSGYTFTGWNLGAVGATITLSSNTTAYAQWVQAVTNYGYTGGVQSFTAPASGTYKLEVWGAKGGYQSLGGSSGWDYGGNGGYSYGNVYLTAGQTIYVVCGGYNSITGGENAYNGGGAAYRWGGYGGGATHIATTNRGVLSNYDSYRSEVLIVAGGGGGSGAYCEVKDDDDEVIDDYYATGGSGGGTTGGNGDRYGGQGATQSAGGKGGPGWQVSEMSGSFGQGGYSDYHRGSGGGGGWYGGGGGESGQGGGGGSGYIGGVSSGGMSNGVNAGQGKAKITLIA